MDMILLLVLAIYYKIFKNEFILNLSIAKFVDYLTEY
jgi:hypothetical protein